MTPRAAFLAKHAARIERDPVFGCWIWADHTRASLGRDKWGYGTIWTKEGPRSAHTVAYREIVGPIPEGKVLDHVCRRRACCRPEHLNPITGQQNDLLRKWSTRARQTKCKNGHDLSTCITIAETAARLCRICEGPESE